VLPQIGEVDLGNQIGGDIMMKRCLQGFLLLLVVMSTAAVANDFPRMEDEPGDSMRNPAVWRAGFELGQTAFLFKDAASPILSLPEFNRCGSSFSMADWNKADVDESMHWDSTADYSVEYTNKEESMNSGGTQNDENAERAAMKKLDFVIGKWEGEGWLLVGPGQRHPFSVTELYNYRCNGSVIDGEGRFRPQGVPGAVETDTMYGLGMTYFDRQSGEYRMWHYGGSGISFVFTAKIDVDVEGKGLHYINKDARGETYKFGFTIDKDEILTARTERQKLDGTWYVSGEFRMRRVK
jgi:hypothetical protein